MCLKYFVLVFQILDKFRADELRFSSGLHAASSDL